MPRLNDDLGILIRTRDNFAAKRRGCRLEFRFVQTERGEHVDPILAISDDDPADFNLLGSEQDS